MRVATAWLASGPVARTRTRWPLLAPSPITSSTLLASTLASPTTICTADAKPAAATASIPAGRACRSPDSVISASELSGMASLLRRGEHRLDVPPDGGRHRRRDRSLHEGSVGQLDRFGKPFGFGQQ